MLDEINTLRCFIRNANNTIGYLFSSSEKDPSSFDRMISTHQLDDVSDTNFIKWELIAFDEQNKNNMFLLKNVKFSEFLCASKYHSDITKYKRKVSGWKLKFEVNQKINVFGQMVDALHMMKEEKRCIWKLINVQYNKYLIMNVQYSEPLLAMAVPNLRPIEIKYDVYTWHRSDANGTEFNWFIDCITIDFKK